jgi:hypothetical protein
VHLEQEAIDVSFSEPLKNRGAALAAALILLVSLTLIAVTVAYRAIMDELMAANQRDSLNAMSIADSGIEVAFAEVKHPSDPGDDYPVLGPDLMAFCDNGNFKQGNLSYGSYTVIVTDCISDPTHVLYPRAILRSTGIVNGAERVAEAVLTYDNTGGGGDWPVFLANDYILISDPNLYGDNMHIHSNYRLKVSGAPEICVGGVCDPATATEGLISASGIDPTSLDPSNPPSWWDPSNPGDFGNWDPSYWDASIAYDPKTYEAETANRYPWNVLGRDADGGLYNQGGTEAPGSPIDIPHVNPMDYKGNATVELTADCLVVGGAAHADPNQRGQVIWNENTQGNWNGWSCSPGQIWEMKDSKSTMHSGFFYVHGNIKISASLPSAWQATFVAAGSIEIGCCSEFIPYGNTGDATADNIFVMAGNDIAVYGSPSLPTEAGIIAAHGQVKLSGSDSYFKGSIIAEDYLWWPGQENVTNVQAVKELAAYNLINSNVWLEGTGIGLDGGGAGKGLVVAGWRELVH